MSERQENAIEIEDLAFGYGGPAIFKGLNLRFDGRTTAIIGQNGAGKTTLVKLIKALLKPKGGRITIFGEDTANTTAARLAPKVGLVFQNPNDQIFKSNVLDEVMFGPICIGQPPDAARQAALAALETVGLTGVIGENPQDLTLSDRKMLCVASIFAMNCDVVILDEPTIAQDWRGKRRIADVIAMLKERGKVVIAITHDMDFVAENFERVIVLQQGGAVMDGTPREIFSQKANLKAARVEPPQTARLSEALGLPLCLTEEELGLELEKRLQSANV